MRAALAFVPLTPPSPLWWSSVANMASSSHCNRIDTRGDPQGTATPSSFFSLPAELRNRILTFACQGPVFGPTLTGHRSPLALDKLTTLSLCLVCKDVNAQVTELLYANISITRGSELIELLRTL